MMKRQWLIWFAVVVFVTSLAFPQDWEDMDITSINMAPHLGSTRSLAMAGAYSATDAGLDALFSNPGGLGFAQQSQFAFGGRMILFGKNDYEDDYYSDDGLDATSGFGIAPKITNIGACVPVAFSSNSPTQFFGAIGYRSFYDWNRKDKFEISDEDNKEEAIVTSKGIVNQLTFGGGLLLAEKYSVGLSLGIPMFSRGVSNVEYEESSPLYNEKATGEIEYDVKGGTSFQVGAMAKFTPELTIGFSYLGSHKFELENGKEKWKSEGETETDDLSDVKYEIPSMFSLGASYRISPMALITAEYQNRPFEDIEINGYQLGDENIESGSAIRFGFEGGQDVLFRLGYGIERTLYVDVDEDPVNMNMITGGLGFKSNNALIDIAAIYRFTKFDGYEYDSTTYEHIFNEFKVYATLKYNFDFVFSL